MRDGAGARTLYWTRHQGRVIYAREPKALWSLPDFSRRIRATALAQLSPLFDETLLTLSFAMPERLKLGRAIEKVILKRAYARRLPKAVIDRPKSGMRVPVHYWFQGEMRRYARQLAT